MWKLELAFPIEHRGSIVRTTLVRPPTPEDIAYAAPEWRPGDPPPSDLPGAILRVARRITDLPEELVDELDCADLAAICDLIGGFGNARSAQ